MTRIALLHTGAVVIPAFSDLAAQHLPEVGVQHLLDSAIVGDIGAGASPDDIEQRLTGLAVAARSAGAEAVVLTCSSISAYASSVADRAGIPVLRIDEAMADEAVATGERIAVIATLPTTLHPTAALLRERAAVADRDVHLVTEVVDGAFAAVSSGDRATHDELVVAAVRRLAPTVDVVVLAQASMASAALAAGVDVPVLSSPELGMRRVAERIAESEGGA